MFKTTKLKLTAWYLCIIMAITFSFSSVVYLGVVRATQRALISQKRRIEHEFRRTQKFDEETFIEIREKTLAFLAFINLIILVLSGGLGYLLAERTLKPIEQMINKQKRFVSDATHELKTPITAMKADIEVTLRNKKLNIEDLRKSAVNSLEELEKLNNLASKLLIQSKYQNSDINLVSQVKVDVLLNEVISKLEILASKNEQKFKKNINNVSVKGDYEALKILFTNVIENAIKYNKNGKNLEVSLDMQKNFAVIEIKDYGIGINEKELNSIFVPFYRTDESRSKHENNGFGLGLAISKEIVEKHKGTINITSKIGEGTTVTIRLPVV